MVFQCLLRGLTGKVREQQPAEGSKLPQDNMTYNRCRIYKRSQSLNIISTTDQTKADTLKQVKSLDKRARERRDRKEKPPGRNEGAGKLPRNKGSGKDPTKTFQIRQDVKSLFRNERIKKHVDWRDSTEEVHKSRLVPPRPAKDIILDKMTIVSSIMAVGKQNSLTKEKQTQDIAVVIGNETPSSDTVAANKSLSAVDHIFQNQAKDGNTCRDVRCSKGELVPDIPVLGAKEKKRNKLNTATSVDTLKENEFVDKMAEIDGEECDGSFEDEDTKLLIDLVKKNEMVVSMGKTSQSLLHQQQTVSENLGSTLNEVTALKKDNPKPRRIYEGEPVREAVQIQEKIQDNSSEHLGRNDQTETPNSSTLSPFVPIEMWKDWSGLEDTIQSMLRGFIENQGFVAEISRIFPDVSGSLNQWISDLEETLKNVAENVSDQYNRADQVSTGQMTVIKLTTEGELPLKDLQEGIKTSEDPESMEQGAAGHSAIIKQSGMLEVASLEVHPQTSNVSMDSRKVCEDVQDPPASDDQENTSWVMSTICKFKVEVIESSSEEKSGMNSVDKVEEKQSQSDPLVTSCSEEFVFVESYFAEPAKTKMVAPGSDLGLVDSSTRQVAEVVAKANKQREIVHRSQSCLVIPVEEVIESQFKRYRMLSTNSHVGRGSKVRRLIEITADEIKAMAVPELVLMSLQEGIIFEDRRVDELTGSNTEDLEEQSAGDIDSCEEIDEEAEQQLATQHQPVMEVIVEDVKVTPVSKVKHLCGRKGFSLDSRKGEHKTGCKIS